MESLSEVPFDDFDAALTPARVRRLQFFSGLAVAGVTVGWLMVLVVYIAGVPRESEGHPPAVIATIGTALHALSFCSGILLWFTYTHFLLSPRGLERAASRPVRAMNRMSVVTDPVGKCVALVEKFVFLRFLAITAGAGVGMFAAWCAVLSHVMRDQPAYWLNAATTVALVLWVVFRFPTRERLQALFLDRIAAA